MTNASRSLNLFFSKNTFKGSFNSFTEVPNKHLPECCFIGRSNVGKSSIINAITKSKNWDDSLRLEMGSTDFKDWLNNKAYN